MSYAQFLALLISLGSKVPQLLQAVAELEAFIVPFLQKYAGLFTVAAPVPHAFAAHAPGSEEHALEQQVVGLCQEHHTADHPHVMGAIGDGKILALLQKAFAFVQSNPVLWAAILKLTGL